MRNTNENTKPTAGGNGPEKWVRDAIAQQEEYLKRRRPCMGIPLRQHFYEEVGDDPRLPHGAYRACSNCGVTETDEGYRIRMGSGEQ